MTEHYKNLSLKDIPGEEWRDIEGFEGFYQVSNKGRVKSLERKIIFKNRNGTYRIFPEKILKQFFSGHQVVVHCCLESRMYNKIVGRLVFNAFSILEEGKFVLHKNFVVHDNRIENLYLGFRDELSNATSKANGKNRCSKYKGVYKRHNKRYISVISINKLRKIKSFKTELEAAKKYDYYVKKYKLNRELNFPDDK
jgi:hypothetical protein